MGVVQHIPEWLKHRNTWYIQIFNICNWTLASLAAWASFHGVAAVGSKSHLQYALAGLAAAGAMVAVNHTLMAPMLHLARGHCFRAFPPTSCSRCWASPSPPSGSAIHG
jgi:hypothetical protein